MDRGDRSAGPAGRMPSTGLGVVFAIGTVFTAVAFMTSWGGTSWMFGSAVSVIVGGLALMRERQKTLLAFAGLVVTFGAVVVSLIAGDDLPQEPAPMTALALSVLVGSAIRTLPTGAAAQIATGGVVVTGVIWFDGLSGVTTLATMGMIAALVIGPVLRGLDRDRHTNTRVPRGPWTEPPRS